MIMDFIGTDEIVKWFDINYIEEKITIYKVLEEATIRHSCTFQSLFESCQILISSHKEKTSLGREVGYLKRLSDIGLSGRIAGELLIPYIYNTNNK